jgi:hypothetical protein
VTAFTPRSPPGILRRSPLLAPDAVVLESGSRDLRQYAAHHLAADIEFSRAVLSQRS